MKVQPLAVGAGAGLLLALLLAPATGNALGELAKARADRARLAQLASAPTASEQPLAAEGLATQSETLAARIRDRARGSGLLVEELTALPGDGKILAMRLRVSGGEKAVLAFADGLERQAPLARLRVWRLAPTGDGGVRLIGEIVAVRA